MVPFLAFGAGVVTVADSRRQFPDDEAMGSDLGDDFSRMRHAVFSQPDFVKSVAVEGAEAVVCI